MINLLRPFDYAEHSLITAILEGKFPPGSVLPGERDLAVMLGITRPTLREALRHLERDGWIMVQQGKPTLVNNFWYDGGLNVLSGIVKHSQQLPKDFITNLLKVRLDIAPSYTRLAMECAPEIIKKLLHEDLPDTPEAFAAFDWKLQRQLTIASGNPVYALILNGFSEFYEKLAVGYFMLPEARESSRQFYTNLLNSTDLDEVEMLTRQVMQTSIVIWQKINGEITR